MKKIDLGQTINTVANAGVIAGIIFLAIEIQQNNELIASEARFNRLAIQTASITLAVEHSDLAELLFRSRNGDDITPVEAYRIGFYWNRVFANMQWTYLEAYDDIPLADWRNIFQGVFAQAHWETQKPSYDPEFAQFVDENAVNER